MDRTELLETPLSGPPAVRLRATRVELEPGRPAGPHRHPCDVVGTVLAGTIEYELAGRETVTLRAGDAFFEPRDHRVERFDNASPDEPAVFVACYLLPEGVDEVIESLPGS